MTNILIPVEEKKYAEAQVEFLGKHELPADTTFTILTVIAPLSVPDYGFAVPHSYIEAMTKEETAACRKLLDETKASLKKRFPNSTIKTQVENGRPAPEILRAAKEDEIDWIILGSHGRTGLDRFFLGSVSLSVVNHAHCSVTIVRIPEPQLKAEGGKEVAGTARK